MSKMKLLMGATALVTAAAGFVDAASATVSTNLYGGGSSLVAPYLRQAEDCWGNPVGFYVIKGSALNNPTTAPVSAFNYTGTPAQNCATTQVDTTVQLNYISTGSGTGLKGLFTHNASSYWGDVNPPTDSVSYPSVDYANAETAMLPGDVTAWNSGGSDPATGLTFGGTSSLAIPYGQFGHMIQIPLLITPVDITYSPVYKKVRTTASKVTSYKFNIHAPGNNGGLVLDAATYCAIFNGQITDWNQIPVALNGGVSLQATTDPSYPNFSLPLVMVGRSDGSGTSSVFTRHLAAQCPSVISGALITEFNSSISSAAPTIYNASWNKANPNFGSASGVTDVPGKYTGASGSDGVADYVQFDPNNVPGSTVGSSVSQGRMGYIGPDFVLPNVNETQVNSFGLDSADLLRPGGAKAIAPTGANAKLAFASVTAPTGAPGTGGSNDAGDPTNWVQSPLHTAPVALPSNPLAYPIVGTSNLLTYTCFADATVTAKWVAFLKWFETSKTINDGTNGLLAKAGFAPMPGLFTATADQTFFAPTTGKKPFNLYILQAGTGPSTGTGSQCNAITPGA